MQYDDAEGVSALRLQSLAACGTFHEPESGTNDSRPGNDAGTKAENIK